MFKCNYKYIQFRLTEVKTYTYLTNIQNGFNDSFKEDETEGKRDENFNIVSFYLNVQNSKIIE